MERRPFKLLPDPDRCGRDPKTSCKPWGVLRKRAPPRVVASIGRMTSLPGVAVDESGFIDDHEILRSRRRAACAVYAALRIWITPPFGRSMRCLLRLILTPLRCSTALTSSSQISSAC